MSIPFRATYRFGRYYAIVVVNRDAWYSDILIVGVVPYKKYVKNHIKDRYMCAGVIGRILGII